MSKTKDDTTTPITTYGNLEITVEGITKKQLDALLKLIILKVESMRLSMVSRSYMTTDDDIEDIEESTEQDEIDEIEGRENVEKRTKHAS